MLKVFADTFTNATFLNRPALRDAKPAHGKRYNRRARWIDLTKL